MEFRILGPLEVWRDGERLQLGGAKQRALLAILLMQRNHVVAADRLIELLWGDDAPETAAHTLQVHVSQLRKVLPATTLESRLPGYLLHAADEEVDAGQFEARLAAAKKLRQAGDLDSAVRTLREGLALWRGQPLADVAAAPFALAEVARLSELRVRALEDRIDAELALGMHADLVPELEALVAEHPLRERLCAQLMLALYRCGRQAEASNVYYRTRARLVDELGMEPGPALQGLLKDILKQDPGLATPSPAPPASRQPHSNLPHQLTSFIGRETEVTVVTRLLADHRLVTLTGPGGIGKTRLAIEAARRIHNDRPVPVYFIDLAPLADRALVPQTIASVLGLPDHATRSASQTVVEFLAAAEALLLLDNCEHLLAAAATVAEAILQGCPAVRVLATSRERLDIPGERVWPVSPLRSPDPDRLPATRDLARFEAIQLFTERALAIQPSFMLVEETAPAVARICHSLDGMPLALELAAAQTSLLSPDQIVTRLDDRFRLLAGGSRTRLARHQTLRATIEWSHNLLNGDEQRLFRRLSVFAGGFSLEAVESVCADPDDGSATTLPTLRKLIDASLVLAEEGQGGRRYRLLETIREYSRGWLIESDEVELISSRLVSYLTQLATGAEERARGADSERWLARMEEDHANLRAALDWSASNDRDAGVRLALVWVPFWIARGYVREGHERLARALRDGIVDEPLRAVTLNAAGRLAMWGGEFAKAQPLLEQAIPLLRCTGPIEELALALLNLDAVHAGAGSRAPYSSLLEEALALARESGDAVMIGSALNNSAELAAVRGELDTARRLFGESLGVYRDLQNLWGIATVLEGLAWVDMRAGDLASAAERISESLSLYRRRNDRLNIGMDLLCMANIAALQGQFHRALRLAGAAESIRRTLGIALITPAMVLQDREEIESNTQRAKEALGPAAAGQAWDQGTSMSVDQAVEYAMTTEVERLEPTPLTP